MDPEIPEVGAVIDGYRFKGGDPAQESSWEQVAPIDVSAQYGPGARQLPNGVIERVGPRGGVTRIGTAEGGQDKPLVGADARARFMINLQPLVTSQQTLSAMDREGYNPSSARNTVAAGLEAIPFDGGFAARLAGGGDYNSYTQAAKTFEAAILPIMSGAAVTPTEAQRLIRAALPQPGDSPEVLARKAAQREQMINAVAAGIGEPEPFPNAGLPSWMGRAGPINPETGLPTYPGIMELTQDAQDFGLPPGSGGSDGGGPTKPGGSPDTAIDVTNRELLLSAGPGAYVRFPDGTVERLSGAPIVGQATGEQVAGGVYADRGATPSPLDDPLNPLSGLKRIYTDVWEPFAQSAAEQIPFLDEAAAGLAGLTTGQGYRAAREAQAGLAERDRREAPLARNIGGIVGAVAPAALPVAAPLRAVQGGSKVGNALRMGVGGAGYGALYGAGAGEGSLADRAPGAFSGAMIGGAIAPVAAPATNALAPRIAAPIQSVNRFVGRQVGRAGEALGVPGAARLTERAQPNALASGVGRLASRMGPERVNALNPRGAEQRGLGMEPALIDALDDATLGTMRALATRDTPARDAAVRFAEGRRANLPTRVGNIARQEISGETTPALQMVDDLTRTRRANASAIDDFDGDQIALPPQVISALRSDLVQPALRGAAQRARAGVNPADAEAANRLSQLAQTVLDDPSAARLTVRESQDLSKALNDAATAAFRRGEPEGPVFRDLAKAIRDNARDASPGYANWLGQYGDDSDLIEAATTGRNLVSPAADPMSARSTEAFVRNAAQAPEGALPIMRAAGREAVEAAASNPGAARTTLDRMTGDQDFGRRMGAIGVDAPRVQARARAELDAVTRAQRISPRVGSETATNAQDAAGAAGLAMDVMTAPVRTVFRGAVNRIVSRGFNDQEAEAVVQLAIDPARFDEAVNLLAQRMTRREARNAARAVRYELTAALQSGQER